MTDVGYDSEELEEILKMMGSYYKDMELTIDQQYLIKKTEVMYQCEKDWDEAEED